MRRIRSRYDYVKSYICLVMIEHVESNIELLKGILTKEQTIGEMNLEDDLGCIQETYEEMLGHLEHLIDDEAYDYEKRNDRSAHDMVSEQKLKPAEGLCISLPNGKPALQFISYKDCTVYTIREGNHVKLEVEFDEPFIQRRADDLQETKSPHHSGDRE